MSRILSFLSKNTEVGFGAVCVTGISLFGINFIPHSLLLEKYKGILQAYKDGVEREITPKTDYIFYKSLDLVNFSEYEKKLVKNFAVYGFDAISIGCTKFRNGARVGIPVNYSYESVNDIDRTDIMMRSKKIDWNSKAGQLLEDALLLSEDEKVFGITRAILESNTYKPILQSAYPIGTILFMYTAAAAMNRNLKLFYRPFAVRGIMYIILGVFGFGLWSFMNDFTTVHYDTKIDKEMSNLGEDIIAAGVRFYRKLLQKNIAVRELSGDSTYTAKGNLNYLLRQKTLPLTIRKMFFEMKLKELETAKVTIVTTDES